MRIINKIKDFLYFKKYTLSYNFMVENNKISNFQSSIEKLSEFGFSPKIIFDIGSFEGDSLSTFIRRWPNSNIVSFEIIPEKVDILKEKFKNRNVIIRNEIVSNSIRNEVGLFLDENATSIHASNDGRVKPKIYLEQTTIDEVIREINLIPNLLHIDTVTNELEILLGAEQALKRIDVVIVQVNVLEVYDVKIRTSEIFVLLEKNGLVLFDILEIHRRPKDNIMWNMDLIFVQKDSKWRRDKKW